MHFVILVHYAVINAMGRLAFSQKCDHRHNLTGFLWIRPEMNCSNTHIKWSLPLLKSQPASCEWQKHICSSVIANVCVLMLTFIINKVSQTGSFLIPKGVFVQLHWYVQGWLILVKHCCSCECSHLNFCYSSVVISIWLVHEYTWSMGQSAEDPSLEMCLVRSIL